MTTTDQLTLFPEPAPPPKPRRRPRVLMDVKDAGHGADGTDIAEWRCDRCGHETGWIPAPTVARPPCPRCNAKQDGGR